MGTRNICRETGAVTDTYQVDEMLTFGELDVGDKFIGMPMPGDDSGHGGFKNPSYIFQKIEVFSAPTTRVVETNIPAPNARKLCFGVESNMPDSMPVIRVQ